MSLSAPNIALVSTNVAAFVLSFLNHGNIARLRCIDLVDDRGSGCTWLVASLILAFSRREKGQEPSLILISP